MAKYPISEAPSSDDRLAIGVQNGLQKDVTGVGALPDFTLPYTKPMAEIDANIDAVKRGLLASDVNPSDFKPDFLQSLGSYFRSENTVGSALSSKSFGEFLSPTPDAKPMSTDELLKNLELDKLSYATHLFDDVTNAAQYAAKKADILREQEDQRIMQATSGLSGTAMLLAAGIIDLPTLMPGTIGVKLGARGVSTGKAFLGTASAAMADATVTELALHGTQVDRSFGESAAAVGGSVILGGALGMGLHAAARRALGPNLTRVEDNIQAVIEDLANGAPNMKAANAASMDAYATVRRSGIDDMKPVSSGGMFGSLEALGKIPGFIGKNMRIPTLDLNQSLSHSALSARAQAIFTPFLTKGELEVNGPTVQALLRDNMTEFSDIAMTFNKEYNAAKSAFKGADDFDRQVTYNLLDPRQPAHPAVQAVAAEHRKLYNKILDQLVEAKVLPPEVKAKYGDTYVPMVFDAMAIRAREGEFKELISAGFTEQFRKEAEEALRLQGQRRTQNEESRARIMGVTEKQPQFEADGVTPKVNPATGKQVQKTVVLKEGTLQERQRITREQYTLETERVRENRDGAFKVFDDETANVEKTVGKIYDDHAKQLSLEHAAEVDKIVRNAELSDAAKARQVKQLAAELKKQVDAAAAERSASMAAITKKRREDKKKLAKTYDDQLADAKKIRDSGLLDANEKATKAYADAKAPLREGLDDGLKFVRDGEVDADAIEKAAREYADRWYGKTTGNTRYTLEHELDGQTDFLKKRRTPVPHTVLIDRGFVNGQAHSLLEDYTRMAGFDAARATVMKKSVIARDPSTGKLEKDAERIQIGDIKGTQLAADIEGDYDALIKGVLSSPEYKASEAKIVKKYEKLIEKAPNEEAKKALYEQATKEVEALKATVETKLVNQRDRDIENLEAIFSAMRGGNAAGWSPSGIRAAEAVSTLNYVRLMGGTVLSSMTDPVKIAISVGLGNTVKGAILAYHQATSKAWDKANAAEKGITRATAWSLELNTQSRIASMSDIGNPLRFDDSTSTFMRNAAGIFSRVSGITYWNAFMKQVSENATSGYLGQLAYKGFDNLNTSERRWLNSLRINKDGLELIRSAHEAQPHSKFHDDWPLLDHEKWADPEASRLVRHALGEEINNQVVSPQGVDRMLFSLSPGGKLIMQFRQHMISNQMRFLGRQLQQIDGDAHRAAAAGVGFVGLVTAGALVDYLKQVVGQVSPTGNLDNSKSATERHIEEWTKTPGSALYNALDRSDALPMVFSEPTNILDKMGWIGPKKAFTSAFDDPEKAKEASRFKNRSVFDAVGGPAVGLANDVIKGVPALAKVLTGQRVNRGDYRSGERLIPGQNIPYVQMLTNSFEKYVGDVHSWPNPK